MNTITLHAHVERSRFFHHALAWLARWAVLPTSRRAAAPSPAREAQQVRLLARRYQTTDPGFAADLYAAAARHESLHSS